jgi:uncharacterized membrane protein YccC
MELDTIADVEKLHAAFVKSINATAESLLEATKLDPQDVLADKRGFLAELKAQLQEATDARAVFDRAYDREITQREAAIASLEAELKADAADLNRLLRPVGKRAGARGKRRPTSRKKRR